MKNAGLHDWPLYVHTRCHGLLCANPNEALANKFLVPTEPVDGEWPAWTGAPGSISRGGLAAGDELWVGMHRNDEIRPNALRGGDSIAVIRKNSHGVWPEAWRHTPHVPPLCPCKYTLLLSWKGGAQTSLSK